MERWAIFWQVGLRIAFTAGASRRRRSVHSDERAVDAVSQSTKVVFSARQQLSL